LTEEGVKKYEEGKKIWKIMVESMNNILGEKNE